MGFVGVLSAVIVIGGLLVFFFLNNAIDTEIKTKNTELKTLIEFGKSAKSFELFAVYAAKTRFNQVIFYKLGSSEAYVFKGNSKPSSGNELKLPYEVSAQDKDSIRNILFEIKSGSAIFSDPQDNPLMYSRPYLRVEFDEGIITMVTDGNLG